jgi:hypothetical protein
LGWRTITTKYAQNRCCYGGNGSPKNGSSKHSEHFVILLA